MKKEKYIETRKVYSSFVYEILNADENARNNLIEAGKRLNFWDGKQLVFETEEESSILMDFLLYEKNGKSDRLIDRFKQEHQNLTLQEDMILNGMIENHDSLFEVMEINKKNSIIKLLDLLTKQEFKLKDIGFSKTIELGILIYTRLVPIDGIHMTSGISFCFHSDKRLKLLTEISKQKSIKNKQYVKKKMYKLTLYEKMFQFSKSFGIEVNTINYKN